MLCDFFIVLTAKLRSSVEATPVDNINGLLVFDASFIKPISVISGDAIL